MERLDLLLPETGQNYELVHTTSVSSEASYLVDLNEYSCSCPDFAHRASAPARSITRACKHIAQAILYRPELLDQMGELEHAVLDARGRKTVYFRTETKNGGVVVVGVDGESGWADVFFRKYRKGDPLGGPTGAWDCYGLDRLEWRWSYGEGPRGAREIKELLAQFRISAPDRSEPRGSVDRDSGSAAGCLFGLLTVALALAGYRTL